MAKGSGKTAKDARSASNSNSRNERASFQDLLNYSPDSSDNSDPEPEPSTSTSFVEEKSIQSGPNNKLLSERDRNSVLLAWAKARQNLSDGSGCAGVKFDSVDRKLHLEIVKVLNDPVFHVEMNYKISRIPTAGTIKHIVTLWRNEGKIGPYKKAALKPKPKQRLGWLPMRSRNRWKNYTLAFADEKEVIVDKRYL